MKRIPYGVCSKCNSWGVGPDTFNESKHFLQCSKCNALMYLQYSDPKESAYRDKDKVEVKIVKQ